MMHLITAGLVWRPTAKRTVVIRTWVAFPQRAADAAQQPGQHRHCTCSEGANRPCGLHTRQPARLGAGRALRHRRAPAQPAPARGRASSEATLAKWNALWRFHGLPRSRYPAAGRRDEARALTPCRADRSRACATNVCGCRRRRATPSRSNHTPAPKIRSSNTGNFAPTRRDDGAWSGICQSFVFRKPAVSKSQETVQRLQGPRVAGKATRQAWAWGLGATQAEPSAKVALRLASHNLAPFPRPSGLSWKSGARPYTTLAK